MLMTISWAVDAGVYLVCLFVASEIIKQLNIGRLFTKNTNLIGFLLSLALGALIFSPVSYGLTRALSFFTRYSGESFLWTASETILGVVFLGGVLMLYNNWKGK